MSDETECDEDYCDHDYPERDGRCVACNRPLPNSWQARALAAEAALDLANQRIAALRRELSVALSGRNE